MYLKNLFLEINYFYEKFNYSIKTFIKYLFFYQYISNSKFKKFSYY